MSGQESLSEWLDKHQHIDPSTQTRIILIDSKTGSNYKFSVAFLAFILEGEIDLSTKEIKNGSLYIDVPLWGLVKMVDGIAGNLGGAITCNLPDSPSIKGSLTLSLDQTKSNLIIKYDFDIKFLGNLADKIPLFPLPAPGATDSTGKVNNHTSSARSSSQDPAFEKFLHDHWNAQTQVFLIASSVPRSTGIGILVGPLKAGISSESKAYEFRAGFLGLFELKGAVEHDYTVSGANLYLTVPLWGRVDLATFSGSLASGIQHNVEVSGVHGTVTLKLGPSKEVKIGLDLNTKSAGPIKGDFELFKPEFK